MIAVALALFGIVLGARLVRQLRGYRGPERRAAFRRGAHE